MRRVLATIALTLAATGCAASTQSTAPLRPTVGLGDTPSTNAQFDFCEAVPKDAAAHLGNVAWLAFMAANEYSHANVFGPMLAELGFGSPSGGDLDWRTCTDDLRRLRAAERGRERELDAALGGDGMRALSLNLLPDPGLGNWGDCARTFLSREDLPRDAYPAAAFQSALVGEVRHGDHVQFFTAGGLTEDRRSFRDSSTQVVFARHREKRVAILAFRGTEPAQRADLMVDAKTWKTSLADQGWPASWGKAHAGFVEAYASIAPLVEEKLRELDGTGVKLWVTGHSLGGALATLAFARLLRMDAPAIELGGLVTFGSPRVGDAAFAATFHDAVAARGTTALRVRNGNDVVTTIPGIFLEYEHVGTLVHVEELDVHVAPSPEPSYDGVSLADHDVSGYEEDGDWRSGYYRRLHFRLRSGGLREFTRCEDPP